MWRSCLFGKYRSHARNRLYSTLNQINQAIVHNDERDKLFHEICRVAIVFGQYRMAWVGVIDETTYEVKPVVIVGEGGQLFYLPSPKTPKF